jgi:NAD(P)H-dependent flavin oxidoreductase YrpB (nitropropane dioxygenase family)
MSKFLESKYPILLAPMNKVSDINLAIAVHKAGGLSSISMYNFRFNGVIDYALAENALRTFKNATDSTNILLSISANQLKNLEFIKLAAKGLFSKVELICEEVKLKGITLDLEQVEYFKKLKVDIEFLKNLNIKILCKSLTKFLIIDLYNNFQNSLFDAFIIKGPDAAGTVVDINPNRSLEEDILNLKKMYPDIVLIASGGIGNSSDVNRYLEIGADSVAIGTLFAMSKESVISVESKNFILQNKNTKIEKFEDSNQRAIIFSKIEEDDFNHTGSLVKGILNPKQGHIFVGNGISKVKEILQVEEIMQSLIKDLK